MFHSVALGLFAVAASANALNLTVNSSRGNATSPLQYGIMFEDINYSGDGGIYAELVRNRAFQGSPVFPSNLTAWSSIGDTVLTLKNLSDPLSSALPTSMNVALANASSGTVGFANAYVDIHFNGFVILTIFQWLVGYRRPGPTI